MRTNKTYRLYVVRVYCAQWRLSFIYVATFIGTEEPSAARYAANLPQNTANEMSCNVLKTKTFPPTSIKQNHFLFPVLTTYTLSALPYHKSSIVRRSTGLASQHASTYIIPILLDFSQARLMSVDTPVPIIIGLVVRGTVVIEEILIVFVVRLLASQV